MYLPVAQVWVRLAQAQVTRAYSGFMLSVHSPRITLLRNEGEIYELNRSIMWWATAYSTLSGHLNLASVKFGDGFG